MHTVTRAYPLEPTDEDKANYGAFFEAVAPTLPCPLCRANYAIHIGAAPPALGSRDDLVLWLIDIHNKTRKVTGKEPISREVALSAISRPGKNTASQCCVVM